MTPKTHKWLIRAKLVISIILLGSLIYIVDWERAWHVLRHANFKYILLGLIIGFGRIIFAAIRWSLCLHYLGSEFPWPLAYKGYLIGWFYNIFLPGAIGGDVVRVGFACFKGAGAPLRVTGSVIIERILGLMATLIIACLGLLLIGPGINLEGFRFVIPVFSIAGLMGIISFLFFGPKISEKMKKKFPNLCIVQDLSNKLYALSIIKKSAILLLFILSILFQFFDIIASFFWAKAIGIHQPFSVFLFVIPVAFITTVLPISIGGLGVREGTLSFLLFKFGIHLDTGILFAFMLYLHRVFLAIPGGILQILGTHDISFKKLKKYDISNTEDLRRQIKT